MDYRKLATPHWRQQLFAKRYTVIGNSMSPLLKDGDIVYTKKSNDISIDNIVVLPHPFRNTHIIKYVAAIHGTMLELSGLNADESEDSRTFGYIPISQILGIVIAKKKPR